MTNLRATRSPNKPILVPRMDNIHWWERNGIFNAAVAEYKGKILLLYRAYDDYRLSRVGLAYSTDGIEFTQLDHPIIDTDPNDPYERIGIEDPRATKIDDTYYIVHTSASYKRIGERSDISAGDYMPWRVRTGMHSTKDFKTFIHHGVILPNLPSKNSILLPTKINDAFCLYYREFTDNGEVLKISYSKDFKTWFNTQEIAWPEANEWEKRKFGLGAQPILCSLGYLVVSHGVDLNSVYRLGLMLFDKNDPSKLIWHTGPILEPEMPYEKEGFVPNVVYTCGALIRNEELWIYYGGSDRVMGRAVLSMKDIEQAVQESGVQIL